MDAVDMSMWSNLSLGSGAAALGGAIVSGMPANSLGHAVPSGMLLGAGVGLIGLGAALFALE